MEHQYVPSSSNDHINHNHHHHHQNHDGCSSNKHHQAYHDAKPSTGTQVHDPEHPGFVHFVLPLRIVAPPGIDACIPDSFDPHKFFHFQREFAKRAGVAEHSHASNGESTGHTTHEPSSPYGNSVKCNSDPNLGLNDVNTNPNPNPNPNLSRNPDVRNSRKAVLDTLQLYYGLCRHFLYLEEMRGKECSTKNSRPDLQAGSVINAAGLSVNRARPKAPGPVPGVDIGDIFYFRMEIACIGMHGPLQAGIDYISSSSSSSSSSCSSSPWPSKLASHPSHPHYGTPIAVSIISSGVYDSKDDGETLVYTGQGGRSSVDKKPNEDQKLERGNLALEGSMKHSLPIRVIRGVKDSSSPTGKAYTYDGLYRVVGCWTERGKFGFEEYKFQLCRLPRQPELGSSRFHVSNQLKSTPREGLRVADVSSGKESEPVCVVNTVDSEWEPRDFNYITTNLTDPQGTNIYGDHNSSGNSNQQPSEYGCYPQGCDCVGSCAATRTCSCFLRNGAMFSYLQNGMLVKERGSIYECGMHCKCALSCRNRASQRGREGSKFRFEIFKTKDKGWGVRSWDTIPAGSFVSEYTGKIVEKAASVLTSPPEKKEYILDTYALPDRDPPWGHIPELLGRQVPGWQETTKYMMVRPHVIVDSSECGNMSRFIKHSCCSNLLAQCVYWEHKARFPHVMLFAMDNIPPFQELTLDYGFE